MAAHVLAARALPQAVVAEPLANGPDRCSGQTGACAGPAVWLRASRPVLLILFTIVLEVLGFGLIVPVTPFHARPYAAGAPSADCSRTVSAVDGLGFSLIGETGWLRAPRLGHEPGIPISSGGS